MKRVGRFWPLRAVALFIVASSAAHSSSQEGETKKDENARFAYIRVELPTGDGDPEQWHRFRFGYEFESYPRKLADFQKLLEDANADPHHAASSAAAPRITDADYSARVDGDVLVGSGRFDVNHDSNDAGFLSLDGCRVALENTRWEDESAALLGASSDGQLGALVEKSGELQFDWSLRGKRDATGVIRFVVSLPKAARSRLTLDVPPEFHVVTSHGIVEFKQPAADEQVRFEIELGGQSTVELLLVPRSLSQTQSGPAIVRQQSLYSFSKSGVLLRARLNLHVPDAAFTASSIAIDVDPQLQPVAVTLDGQLVPWRPDGDGGRLQVQVSRPLAPLSDNLLEVTAVGAMVLGEAQRLPAVRSVDMPWLGGIASLAIDPHLAITRLDVEGGDVTRVAGTPDGVMGTSVDVHLHRADAAMTIAIDSVPPTLLCEREFAWRVSEDHVEGHLSAILRTTNGVFHDTTFTVPPHWSFGERDVTVYRDGDVGQPAETIAHRLYPANVQRSNGQQIIRLALAQPVKPGAPLRVDIAATHERRLPASSIPLEQLCFAQWPATSQKRTLAALVTSSPLTAQVIGGPRLQPIIVDQLRPSTRQWLSSSPPSIVVQANDGLGDARLHMSQGAPRVRASIKQRATFGDHLLDEQYDVQCTVDAPGVDQVRVMFWPPREGDVQWAFPADLVEAGAQARRVERVDEQAQPDDMPEVWEIALPAGPSQPLKFAARRTTTPSDERLAPISLMSVVGAVTQQGRVVIIGHRGVGLSIDTKDIQPVSPSQDELQVGSSDVVWGAYRYTPTQALAPIDAHISLALNESTPHAFAWRMLLTSTYSPGESSSHRATWLINNDGKDAIYLAMPAGCRIDSIEVDGVQQPEDYGDDEKLRIAIGESDQQVIASVDFTAPQSRWGIWKRLAAPMPTVDIAVLQRSWLVDPPGGYSMTARGQSTAHTATDMANLGIADKLLGALRSGAGTIGAASRGSHSVEFPPAPLVDDLQIRLLTPGATWGQALLGIQLLSDRNDAHPPRLLLIDALAMSSIGVKPEQTVEMPQSAATSLGDVFASAGVALVLAKDHALLTDDQFIQLHRNRLSPTPAAGVWRVTDESLEAFLGDEQTLVSQYVTPQVWASTPVGGPATQQVRWRTAVPEYLPTEHWINVDMHDPSAGVTVYHTTSIRAFALVALIAGSALSLWVLRLRPHWIVATACLLACATVVLEEPWHLPPWGASVGIVLGGALALARRRQRARNRITPASSRAAHAVGLIALLIAGVASMAVADESKTTVYPVWFPVDDEGKSTGVVHLPKPFAAALKAKAKANARPQREWLIDRADYKIEFQWDSVDERLDPGDLLIDFDIVVLDDVSEIELPLPRGELALPEQWATLNDEPIEPDWRLGERTIRVPVAGRGQHNLQLRVRPPVLARGGAASIAVAIPSIPQARLSLTTNNAAPRIDVGNCLGQVDVSQADDSEQRIIEASLGAIDSLSISWVRRPSAEPSDAIYHVDELFWLKLDQEQPTFQAKFKGAILQGGMSHLQIEADSRLKLQAGDAQRVGDSDRGDNPLAIYRLPLTITENGFTASVAFQLPEAPLAGQFALPLLRPLQAKRRRRWVAVDAPAHAKSAPGVGMTKTKIEEFTKRWLDETPAPQAAYSCDLRQSTRLLALTPTPQPLSVSESTTCMYSRRSVEVNYQANIEPGAGPRQFLTFVIPSGMTVNSVTARSRPANDAATSITAQSTADNIAWWGIDQRQLQVFLKAAPALSYEITIVASTPVAAQRRAKAPAIQIAGAALTASRVEIRRRPDALVDVVRHPGFAATTDDVDRPSHVSRRVALLDAQLEQPSAKSRSCTVDVRFNPLDAAGTQITQLVSSQSLWRLRVDLDIDVRSGKLDTLEFEMPAQLADAFTIEPPQSLTVLPTLESRTRRLVITPTEPIDGRFQASLIANDVIPPGEEVRVPYVRPLTEIPLARYVAVPTSFESRDIGWEIDDGLQRLSDAAIDSELAARFANAQLYQVVADPHQAALRSLTEVAGVPLVRLADVQFAWDTAGQVFGRAMIDLEPAGLAACVVELPAAMRLCQLRINNLPAQATALSNNRWRLQLQSTKLPQRIEVLYAGQIDTARTLRQIEATAPVLSDIAIERTLWTVYAPIEAGQPISDAPDLTPGQQSVIRLRAITDMVRLPRHLRLEYSSSETHHWLAAWQQRWQDEHHRLGRGQLVQAALAPSTEQFRLHDIDFNFQQAVDGLEVPAADVATHNLNPLPGDDPFQHLVTGRRVAARRMVKGTSRRLSLQFQPPSSADSSVGKYLVAMAFLFAGVAAWLAPRWLPRSDWPLRCAHGIVVAVAIVAALALWPSLLFWMIVLLLIAGWFWLRRSPHRDPLLSAVLLQAGPRQSDQNIDHVS